MGLMSPSDDLAMGKMELPSDLIGHAASYLDGRSLTSFENTSASTRRSLQEHPDMFKKLLLGQVENVPQLASLRNKDGKRALIAWDGGDFQPVLAVRSSREVPSPRYLHRVVLAGDGWYYLYGGHLSMGVSGEVWRFRVEECRGRGKKMKTLVGGAVLSLKWELVDADGLQDADGADDSGEDDDSDDDDDDDDEDSGFDSALNPAALFNLPPAAQHAQHGAWQALAAAAAQGDAQNAHAVHAALQAAMWAQHDQLGMMNAVGNGMVALDADGNPTRPSPRCAASWTCMPGSNMIYLFGGLGQENDFLSDLWCFEAGAHGQCRWERLTAKREDAGGEEIEAAVLPVPDGRWGHTMVEHNGFLYMFGGSSPGQAYTGLWRLDPSTRPCRWSLMAQEGEQPPARGGHSATVVGDTLYIFGGNITQSVFNDMWAVDLHPGSSWRQIPNTPDFPLPRIGHSAVAMGNRILIYGGRNFNTGKIAYFERYTAGLSCFDTELQSFVRFPRAEAFAKHASHVGGMWHGLRMTGHAAVPCSRGLMFIGGLVPRGHSTMNAWVLDVVGGRRCMAKKRRRRRARGLARTGGCGQS
ncbi:unnamed protein product [Sphacelaria rigidula]